MFNRWFVLYLMFLLIFCCVLAGFFGGFGLSEPGPGPLYPASNSGDESGQSDMQENAIAEEEPEQAEIENETEGLETVNDVSGVYRINVRTNKGAQYSTDITIKDLGSDIQINANYKGIKIPVTGVQAGSRTSTSGTWRFTAYVPLLFDGSGVATIKSTKSRLIITGRGSGDYFSLEGSGNGSATGSGSRISSAEGTTSGKAYLKNIENAMAFAAPDRPSPTPNPISTGAAAAASAIGLAASAGAAARNRVRINRSSKSSSPADLREGTPVSRQPASSRTDSPASNGPSDAESGSEKGGE